jgi:hypothetical protein
LAIHSCPQAMCGAFIAALSQQGAMDASCAVQASASGSFFANVALKDNRRSFF